MLTHLGQAVVEHFLVELLQDIEDGIKPLVLLLLSEVSVNRRMVNPSLWADDGAGLRDMQWTLPYRGGYGGRSSMI